MANIDPSRDYSRPNPELPLSEQAVHLEEAIRRLSRAKQEMEIALRELEALDLRQHIVLQIVQGLGAQISEFHKVRRDLYTPPLKAVFSAEGIPPERLERFGFIGEIPSGD